MRSITGCGLSFAMALSAGMFGTPLRAQVLYGSIVGEVVDTTGAVVPAASVRITRQESNQSRESTTSSNGDYNFPSLPGGTYDVVISGQGFQTFTLKGVAVAAGQVARVDATLRIGAISETVSVTADAAVLQT